MDELCRLCAVPKQSKEFKCKIYDSNLNIEQKLISCCNWNSYRSHDNLPNNICIGCFLLLEQCWYFCETVTQAQQKLYALTVKNEENNDPETQIPIEIESDGIVLADCHAVEIKVEMLPELIEAEQELDVSVSDMKVESILDINPSEDDNSVCDGVGFNDNESDQFIESTSVDMETSKDKTKPSTSSKKTKRIDSSAKKQLVTALEFEISNYLSHQDVNEDGTVKAEKIHEQNLCDWTIVKHRCYKCDLQFDEYSKLMEHFKDQHSNEKMKYICPICTSKEMFLSDRYYRIHLTKFHFPHLYYCCYKCQKFYYDKEKLKEHIRSHPKDPSENVCNICGKSFAYYKNLHFHSLTHLPTEMRPIFECHLCKKILGSKATLQKHMKVHIRVIKSAVCDQCGKAFATASKLKKHMPMHSTDRPFSCDICGKTYKAKADLRRHSRAHQNVKGHICEVCGHRTLEKSALKLHVMRHHSDESPFHCEICGKKYYSARTLKNHQKQHFEHRPFACPLCDFCTINRISLQRHHKHVHLDHKPHACDSCEYRTYSKHNLRLHTTRRHSKKDHSNSAQQSS